MHEFDDYGTVGFKADLTHKGKRYVRDMKCNIDIYTFFHLAKARSKVKINKNTRLPTGKPFSFNIQDRPHYATLNYPNVLQYWET